MKAKLVTLICLMLITVTSVFAQGNKKGGANTGTKIEVLYFHGPQRCKTCVALEKVAKETVAATFAKQVKAGTVVFREIDLSTKEGEKLADKYEIAWSSLIIVQTKNGKQKYVNLTDDGFRYAVNQPGKIKNQIINQINAYLK